MWRFPLFPDCEHRFPEPHAYVQATLEGENVCGMEYKAGDAIPGTKEASEAVKKKQWPSYPEEKKKLVPVSDVVGVFLSSFQRRGCSEHPNGARQ